MIEKSSKGKSMTLKAKSSDIDEFSNNEDSKMKSYITKQFKKFMKNANVKDLIKITSSPIRLSSRTKTKERRMLGMVVSTLFPQGQNALDLKVSVT